jgi:hypothetical protein
MPDFEFEFNQQDRDLIVSQDTGTLSLNDYVRLTIYPTEGLGNVVSLPNNDNGIDGKAIFFSTLEESLEINISPFKNNNQFDTLSIGGLDNDFQIYKNGDDIYIKPNEIFNKFELPQGNYRIQIDFLNQVKLDTILSIPPFLIKQISTSRKEVRLKILDDNIESNSQIITQLTDIFNDNRIIDGVETNPPFLGELDEQGSPLPNPNYKYQFKHVLNIGTGDHIPIMNYTFDAVTDGKNNQSIILKLYEPLSGAVGNLSKVTIEKEVITTQLQDIFYFSDVPDVFFGNGLNPDSQENWINPDNNDFGFQSLDELAYSASIGDIEINSLISSSEYGYPNLNTDFNEFKNHTFFGSAKNKLVNFKTKVETIQSYYSEISSSLSVSSSIQGDSTFVIQKRKDLFDKINEEIKNFTPYEIFLYYDGQTDSTSSAPSLKNYADITPVQFSGEGIELNQHNGFNVVYKHSSEKVSGVHNQFIDLFTDKYFVENKPFFNYSSSIYLSFLMQGDSGSALTWENRNKQNNPPLPVDTLYQNNIQNPDMTGSAYQKYIFEASMSYFIPKTDNNDMADLSVEDGDFDAGSTKIIILSGSHKTGSYQIKDSTGLYPTTVVTQSGIPFSGSIMSTGELFRIFTKNTLSSSLQTWFKFDEGSGTDALNSAGTLTGSLKNGATYATDGVVNTALSLDGVNDCVELSADAFGDLSSTDFSITAWINPTSDVSEFDAIAVRRSDSGKGFVFDLRDKSGEDDGAHPFGIGMAIQGSSLDAFDSSATIPIGSYSHVAAVVDRDANAKLYVNGVEVGSSAIDLTDQGADITGSNNKIGIGARIKDDGTFSNKFPGEIDEFRFYRRALTPSEVNQLFLHPDGKTETKITDVKVTLKDPTDVLPFDNLYHTSSTEWNNWYNGMYDSASVFDTNNIHSFENNLPLYIQNSSDYNEMKDFLNLQGEQYDLIRNHIDSMGTIHKRGYKKTNSPPDNTLPMLLSNMGWQAINPFSGSLTDSLGSYLSGITSIDDIKNNTWRKTLNNLLYIYKSKGTKNSVRALLNVYGYPPDVLKFQEFGGVTDSDTVDRNGDIPEFDEDFPQSNDDVDLDLNVRSGSLSFTTTTDRMYTYNFNANQDRILNFDWWMDDANANTIEFVYKHNRTTQTQTILESSGSGAETLWDLRLIPSSDGISSSFEFRLNNSQVADTAIGTRGVSMSLAYNNMSDGQLWNVMLQRMTSSISGTGIQEYRLHAALQDGVSISPHSHVTMSVSGGASGDSSTVEGRGFFANQNFQSSGSRHPLSSSNLFVGETFSGSLGEVRAWSTTLSKSKFRQHILNKFSTVGNTINSHKNDLIYHFKLNENYTTASVSASSQNLKIIDSAPTTTYSDYSITKAGEFFTGSLIYGRSAIERVILSLRDNTSQPNDDNIFINPNKGVLGNLSPDKPAIESLISPFGKKPKLKTSPKLELYRSPQTYVDNFILDNLGGFNLETLYGNPANYYSQSYDEFNTFREDFFDAHPITVDTNKFIRAHEDMFNHSVVEGVKSLVPARSTFSDLNSKVGVEIRPTVLEKQKYEHEHHIVETNPNTFTASVNSSPDLSTSEFIQPKSGSTNINITNTSTYELPKSSSINVNVTNTTIYDLPKSASISALPSLNNSEYVPPKNGTINYNSIANKSFVNIHNSWGTSSADTHFINFAAGTGSDGNYNVGHIDTRIVFHAISNNNEYYSSSRQDTSNFSDYSRFFNRLYLSDGTNKNVTYDSVNFGTGSGIVAGRMMGKTRYFRTGSDGNITLPRNHVSKFSNPWTDRMYEGAQNITNSGSSFLNVQHEDYSSASFYRVKVTGGENSIYVKGSKNPTKGGDDKIIY